MRMYTGSRMESRRPGGQLAASRTTRATPKSPNWPPALENSPWSQAEAWFQSRRPRVALFPRLAVALFLIGSLPIALFLSGSLPRALFQSGSHPKWTWERVLLPPSSSSSCTAFRAVLMKPTKPITTSMPNSNSTLGESPATHLPTYCTYKNLSLVALSRTSFLARP
jgi:hypothetical protein